MTIMKIGYIQNSPIFGDKQKNLRSTDDLLIGVKADLIVLPELFATGYTFTSMEEVAGLSEDTDGETSHFLCQKSLDTGAIIVAGFIEREGNTYYNSSLLIYAGKLIGVYRKLHLFNKEKLFFTPGSYPLTVYEVNGCKIGLMICFDWIFPEVCRVLALKGAQLIAHPSNLVMPYCQQAMTVRCLENRVFAVTANRVGIEKRGSDEFKFTGGSQITSCNGEILSAAPPNSPAMDFVTVDLARANNKMINPYNDVLLDRRPEFYQQLV
jgi:predicted amidohydrolase